MISNEELVRSLSNVKLVLGNGFDLHCKLHSSYKQYFYKYKEKYSALTKLINKYIEKQKLNIPFYENIVADEFIIESCNVWDYFFTTLNEINKKFIQSYWCDIETCIKDSLQEESIPVNWPSVFRIQKDRLAVQSTYQYNDLMAGIIYRFNNQCPIETEEEFYDFLLIQLNDFEQEFGEFIHNQHFNVRRRWVASGIPNDRYLKCASIALKQLCTIDKLSTVDEFNYEAPNFKEIIQKVVYINGDYEKPIFGIDSCIVPSDPRYIFTKTYRRSMLDMERGTYEEPLPFDNVVVYGHSLNEIDFSYFFPVLDRLEIANHNKLEKKFVFAYSIYDEKNRAKIEKEVRNRVYRLFYRYAESRNISTNLLDSLITEKRVILYEIPDLTGWEYNYKSFFDDAEYEDESE